MVSVEEW